MPMPAIALRLDNLCGCLDIIFAKFLLYFSSPGNFPYVFYIAISHGIDFVVEIGGHALVQRNDGEAVAYGEGVVAF